MRIKTFSSDLMTRDFFQAIRSLDEQVNLDMCSNEKITLPFPDSVHYCFNRATQKNDLAQCLVRIVIFTR